jgi:hypothetical protein
LPNELKLLLTRLQVMIEVARAHEAVGEVNEPGIVISAPTNLQPQPLAMNFQPLSPNDADFWTSAAVRCLLKAKLNHKPHKP